MLLIDVGNTALKWAVTDASGGALMRLAGSGAFGAAARAVHGVLVDPEQDGQQVFLPVKANLAPPMPGLMFTTTQVVLDTQDSKGYAIQASRIDWLPGVCLADAGKCQGSCRLKVHAARRGDAASFWSSR